MASPVESGVRRAVDSGLTAEKAPGEDPAAAPLGTDAETGGAPIPEGSARQDLDRRKEIARKILPKTAPIAAHSDMPQTPAARRTGLYLGLAFAGLALLGIILAVAGLPD